jgi:hypothetical protein
MLATANRKAVWFATVLLGLILTSACRRQTDGELAATPTVAPKPTAGAEYWDGADFAGQPVYSSKEGVSRVAHDAFIECGYGDAADDAIRDAATRTLHSVPQAMVIEGAGWSVTIRIRRLTEDVWLVSCSGKKH